MATLTLLTWDGKTVGITGTAAQALSDLAISAGIKTRTADQDGVHKSENDGNNPAKFTLKIGLDARLKADVAGEVSDWLYRSRCGHKSNITIAGRDIFSVPFLLTSVSTSGHKFLPNGTWLHADVSLTFEETYFAPPQAEPSYDGGWEDDDGGSSKKKSTKTKSSSKSIGTTGKVLESHPVGDGVGDGRYASRSDIVRSGSSSSNLSGLVKNNVSSAAKTKSTVASAVKSAVKSKSATSNSKKK